MVENPYATPKARTEANSSRRRPSSKLTSTKSLAYSCVIMLLVFIVGAVICILCHSEALSFVGTNGTNTNPFFTENGVPTDLRQRFSTGQLIQVSGVLGTILFVCIWSYYSMKNAWVLRLKHDMPSISAGWAAGWYFIPLANYWMPLKATYQIWTTTFRERKSPIILWLWWFCWVNATFVMSIVRKLNTGPFPSMESAIKLEIAQRGAMIGAAVFLCVIVLQISYGQSKYIQRGRS